MTGETRRLYPTLSHAVLRIGQEEARRRWHRDSGQHVSDEEWERLNEVVLALTDWAACDVDQREVSSALAPELAQDPRCRALEGVRLTLWDLMDGNRERSELEDRALRWLLIERCHTAMWDTPGLRELALDECERCLTPIDRPWARDPGCAACRRRFRAVVWEDDEGADGQDGAEEPLMRSA